MTGPWATATSDVSPAPFRRLTRLAAEPGGLALLAFWGFAEATLFFIIPDVGLGILALVLPRRALPLFVAAVLGALAGTAALYSWTTQAPERVESVLVLIPGIDRPMIATASLEVRDGDPRSMAQFGPGAPLKVYTFGWATGPRTPLALAVGVLVNRMTRIAPGLVAVAAIGWLMPGLLRRHDRLVLLAYAAFYILGYAHYWS